MKEFFPLFPLQLVVFPGEKLNLHIFEPRYKQLIAEVENQNTTFGIPAYLNNKLVEIGTELELLKIVKRYPNGEMDIKTQGRRRFIIREFYSMSPGKLFPAGEVEFLEDNAPPNTTLNQSLYNKVKKLYDIMEIKRTLPEDPNDIKTFEVGHHVGLNVDQEYQLLQMQNETERQLFLIQHLEKLMPVVEEMEELRKKAQLNGHFRNIIPPQIR
ncbi:MAG: LON peptidase substrate-binding domain-containing protein [Saprospiraceae bacterium]